MIYISRNINYAKKVCTWNVLHGKYDHRIITYYYYYLLLLLLLTSKSRERQSLKRVFRAELHLDTLMWLLVDFSWILEVVFSM